MIREEVGVEGSAEDTPSFKKAKVCERDGKYEISFRIHPIYNPFLLSKSRIYNIVPKIS